MPRAASASLALPLTLLVALGACSDDGQGTGSEGPQPSESVAAASPAAPDGVDLTEPGTDLEFGLPATVTWRPAADVTGVLELTVEKVVEQRPAVFRGWLRDDAARDSRPYFVSATVVNEGEDDLGGQQVPLYVRDDQGRLAAPWTMGGDFQACQSGPLPTPFAAGDEAELCLVYLVPQQATAGALVFQPSEAFDPITWTGRVGQPPEQRKERAKKTARGAPSPS